MSSLEESEKVSRRGFINVAIGVIVAGVIAGVGGWFIGSTAAPPPKTITVTERVAAVTTKTITKTVKKIPPRKEILIGASLSLTGRYSLYGKEAKWLYERAANIVNEQGGIYLKEYDVRLPIKLIIYDDRSDPATTVSNIEKLCTIDKVDALLGGAMSDIQVPQGRTATKSETPWVGTYTAEEIFDVEHWKWTFVTLQKDEQDIEVLFEWLKTFPPEERPKTAAIWPELSPMAVSEGRWFKFFAEKTGLLKIIYEASYTPGTKDFSDIILETKRKEPDLVWCIPIPPDGLTILKQCREYNFAPKWFIMWRAPTITSLTLKFKDLFDYIITGTIPSPQLLKGPLKGPLKTETLFEDFTKHFGYPPGHFAIYAYTCPQVLFTAIERAGVLDKEWIRRALAETNLQRSVVGPISFPYGYGHAYLPFWIGQIIEGLPKTFFVLLGNSIFFPHLPLKRLKEFEEVEAKPFPPWEKR